MGSCFSCSESQLLPSPTANVISTNGNLRQYNVPVFASQVLQAEVASSSSSSSSSLSSFFLCNSDFLSYNDYIPAVDSSAQLYANHLYFVLPKSKLQHRLTASDMAALAVKASVALQNASAKDAHRRKKARISPVLSFNLSTDVFEKPKQESRSQQQPPVPVPMGFSRSGSVRKLQKYTSRRAKLAVRSFRLKLNTIYEGNVLEVARNRWRRYVDTSEWFWRNGKCEGKKDERYFLGMHMIQRPISMHLERGGKVSFQRSPPKFQASIIPRLPFR